jgi:hypothetical protein
MAAIAGRRADGHLLTLGGRLGRRDATRPGASYRHIGDNVQDSYATLSGSRSGGDGHR